MKHTHRHVRAQADADPCALDRHSNSPTPPTAPHPFSSFLSLFSASIVPHCSISHVSLYPFNLVSKAIRFSAAAAAAVRACIFFFRYMLAPFMRLRSPPWGICKNSFCASSVQCPQHRAHAAAVAAHALPFRRQCRHRRLQTHILSHLHFRAKTQQRRERFCWRHPCSSSRCETVDDFGSISPNVICWPMVFFF